MHTDEAVHAIKFGELLENNNYRYDPIEYHGPTLNYFTLIPAWLFSDKSIKDVNETTLRMIPVFFGILSILIIFLLHDGLGRKTTIFAVILITISPAMVFYSRYYIQEILLICFTIGFIASVYQYLHNKSLIWAILTGIFLGLMHATKETWIISFFSMILAIVLIFLIKTIRKDSQDLHYYLKQINLYHVIISLGSAIIISILFYSSFFSNPQGILDSILTYKSYFDKAGQNEFHLYPWFTYFKWLFFFKNNSGPIWSEVFILILALVGIASIFTKKSKLKSNYFIHFFIFYTIILTIIYCVIPYKTPWSMLSFFQGMIILAAVGANWLLNLKTKMLAKIIIFSFLILGTFHLVWQSYQLNYNYHSDPANPYVYSHPQDDVLDIENQMEKIANSQPEGFNLYIQVIVPESDYWPLPWYLRSFEKIGWWDKVDNDVPNAPVILISPQLEPDLTKKIYEFTPPVERNLYVPLFDSYKELRPGAEIRGYIQYDLWNKIQTK